MDHRFTKILEKSASIYSVKKFPKKCSLLMIPKVAPPGGCCRDPGGGDGSSAFGGKGALIV